MFDLRTLAHVPWPGLAATDCHLLCRFDSRSNFAANPAGVCVVFLLQTSASLSVFKNNLVGPPPFIRSNTVEVPHPNATNTISMPVGTQAPGVPSGNFGKNSENPPQFADPGRMRNQNRCCFFSSLIKKARPTRVQPARLAGSPAPPVSVKLTRHPIPGLLRHAV